MMSIFSKRALVGGLTVVTGLMVLLALAHTPVVRRWILAAALAQVQAGLAIHGEVDRLDYNLLTLTVDIENLRLTAQSHDEPFFAVDRLHLDLPWSAVWGTPAVDTLELTRPRLSVVLDADGTDNLPTTGVQPGAGPQRSPEAFRLSRLVWRDLELSWIDRARDASFEARGLTVTLDPTAAGAAGRVSMAEPARLSWNGRQSTLDRLDGRLTFNGSGLGIDDLDIEAPEGQLTLTGQIESMLADPRVQIEYTGEVSLERASAWLHPEGAAIATGTMRIEGRVQGPATAPSATLSIRSEDLSLASFEAVTVRLESTLSPATLTIDSAELELADGTIGGTGSINVGDHAGANTVEVEWGGLDVGALLSALQVDLPIGIDGSLQGQARTSWRGSDPTTVNLTLDNEVLAQPGAFAEAVTGVLTIRAKGGRWDLNVEQQVGEAIDLSAQATGTLSPVGLAESSLSGAITIEIADLGRAWSLQPEVPASDGHIRGSARAELTISGSLGRSSLAGTLSAEDLRYGEAGPATLNVRLVADGSEAHLDQLEIRQGANVARVDGRLRFATRLTDGRITARLDDLSALGAAGPAWLDPSGSLSLQGTIGGHWPALEIRADVDGAALGAAGQQFETLTGTIRFDRDVLAVERLDAGQADGHVSASGRYDLTTGGYTARVTGQGVRLRPFADGETEQTVFPLTATLDFELEGFRSVGETQARGYVTFSDADWDGRRLGSIRTDLAFADDLFVLDTRLAELSATVRTALRLTPRTFELDADVDDLGLDRLLPRGNTDEPAPLTGTAAFAMHAAGALDDLGSARVTIDVERLEAQLRETSVRLGSPATIRYVDDGLEVDDLTLALGGTRLHLSGAMGSGRPSTLDASLIGDLSDLDALLSGFGVEPGSNGRIRLGGAVSVQASLSGPASRPVVSADVRVDAGTIARPGLPPLTGLGVRASYRDDVLSLERLNGVWQGATLTVSGSLPAALADRYLPAALTSSPAAAPARVTARLESLTPQVLAPFLDADTIAELTGAVVATLELESDALTLDRARGSLTLEQADLEVAGVPLRQRRPTRIELADSRIDFVTWVWGSSDNNLSLGGSVMLTEDPTLDLSATGHLDLQLLRAFGGGGMSTGGQARLDTRLHGQIRSPEVSGTIDLLDAELRLANPRLAVSELNGTLVLSRDHLTTENVQGIANGGSLRIDGRLDFPGLQLAGGSLSLEGRSIAMEVPAGLRTEIDADVTLTLDNEIATLDGTVTLQHGGYRDPVTLTGDLLAALQSRAVTVTLPTDRSRLDEMRFDVRLLTAEDISVDNNYADVELGAALQLVGTVGQPALAGRVTLREGGEIFLAGHVYEIENGVVDFTNPTRIEPNLNVSARTQVSGYNITLTLGGTPATFETRLSAVPPLGEPAPSEADIISLLLTGRTLDQAGSQAGAVVRDQALGLVSGEVLGRAGRAVGLDTVRVEQGGARDVRFDSSLVATETDPGARLTFGKNVSRNVQLIFSQSLTDSGSLTWILGYTPRRNLELRTVVLDNEDQSYEFRHMVSFGGAPAASAAAAASRASASQPPGRVGRVQFSGTPRIDTDDLMSELDVSSGERFDFYRWQRDHDRLEALYHRRRYREVRIRDRRRDTTDGITELEYEIESGPLTTLTVGGYDLPSDVRASMEEAWSRSVFDGFLLEEIRTLALTHLTERSYLQATVTANVDLQPQINEKEIVVDIQPGARTTDRRLDIQGNGQVDTATLERFIADQDLAATSWIDPARLEDALTRLYRAQGLLGASVEVGAPIFEGERASLPVLIDEGPVFRVSEVVLEGVQIRSEADVAAALALEVGSPYTEALAQAARARLDASYRNAGFNAATVTLRTAADEVSGAATVTVIVDEGLRQVLDSVAVTGAIRTHPGVVERALQLQPGDAVDLEQWFRARRRLYNSGVFRSVNIEAEPIGDAASAGGSGSVEPVRARVTLQEWPAYRLRYGVRLANDRAPVSQTSSSTFRPGLVADLTHTNLFGRAATVGASASYTAAVRAFRGFLSSPSLFQLPVTTSLFVSRAREKVGGSLALPFTSDQLGLTVEQRFRPRPSLTVAYSYGFQRNHTFEQDIDPLDPFAFDITIDIARLNTTTVFDTRDDLVDATRGWFHSSSFEYAPEAIGSDLRFLKYLAQQYYYRTLPHDVVIASAVRLGLARGFEQDLIPSERFVAGGGNSVRGYAEDSLGPTDIFGNTAGGTGLLVLSQEVRFPVIRRVRGVAFFDAGNVFASVRDISLRDLRMGVGLGIRFDTPFALLRADYGARIRRSGREPFGRWFFSIGQAF